MKIVVLECEDWEKTYFDALRHNGAHEVICTHDPVNADNVAQFSDADILCPFIHSDLHRPVLEQFPNLKFITTRSTGFDHIDMGYCRENDIPVSNVPTYGENTVAEHVFALLLSISHKIPEAVNRTRRGDFSQDGLQGFDLQGKTMGIIGTGHIGQKTIRIARGFDMDVIAYDLSPDETAAKSLGFTYKTLPDLLSMSDIISLHVPGSESTDHMLSGLEFDQMKDGVILINTARGNVVDVKALLQALASGKVAAAGLDVLPEEPVIREEAELLRSFFSRQHDLETLLADHILLHMRNVIITPHSAFNTKEAVERILKTSVENIENFLQSKCINTV